MTETATWTDRTNLLNAGTLASVYRMRNAAGIIIYIGETTTHLAERIRAHRTQGAGGSPWFGEVASIEAAEVARNERQFLERTEIHRWHPVHNRRCVLCGVHGVPWASGGSRWLDRRRVQKLACERAARGDPSAGTGLDTPAWVSATITAYLDRNLPDGASGESRLPALTYEQGVQAAILWLAGIIADDPLASIRNE